MKNGRDIGEEHFAALQAYVKSGAAIPFGRGGAVNVSKLGVLAGVPRSSFYQNTAVQGLVEELRKANPAAPQPGAESSAEAAAGEASMTTRNADDKKSQRLEKRVQLLEQQNAALVAENYELRRQLKDMRLQLGREDMAIETGRRIPPPVGGN